MNNKIEKVDLLKNIPLSFELNLGQKNKQAKFILNNKGYKAFFTSNEIVHAIIKPSEGSNPLINIIKIKLNGSNLTPEILGENELEGKVNYFIGNNPQNWINNIPTYKKIRYKEIYSGIDLVYYGNPNQLEHDFILKPGANPNNIVLNFSYADNIEINDSGDLLVTKNDSVLTFLKPIAYQEDNNKRKEVSCNFILCDEKNICFSIDAYDNTRTLVIDPILVYSTYFGGTGSDWSSSIAIDPLDNVYITGATTSIDLPPVNPTSPFDPYQPKLAGGSDLFVTKINTEGTGIIYFTYLGGNNTDQALSIAVDGLGNAYLTGGTSSSNFPLKNAIQPSLKGTQNAFITKLSSAGNLLLYSTYFGGSNSDLGKGIAADIYGNAYVIGDTSSNDLIPTISPPSVKPIQPKLDGMSDAFVVKINSDGNAFMYITYLGGSGFESGEAITIDLNFNAYLTGSTTSPINETSTKFPLKNALQSERKGTQNAFVTKINAAGDALVYSTYLGGNGIDSGNGIAVDDVEDVYLTGSTTSTDFPTKTALQPNLRGTQNAFATKIYSEGNNLAYSTYIGGNGSDRGNKIDIDSNRYGYIIGTTSSSNLPPVTPIQPTIQPNLKGTNDAFVVKINYSESNLVFFTYFGGSGTDIGNGIAVNPSGVAFISGWTTSSDFPILDPIQPNLKGSSNAFIAKIGTGADLAISKTGIPNEVYLGNELEYKLDVTNLGSEDAINTVVTDTLPQNVDFISASVSDGSYSHSNGAIIWSIGTMVKGKSVSASIVVKPTLLGEITNTATVTSNTFDPKLSNNTAKVSTNVIEETPQADYRIFKFSTPNPVYVGDDLEYSLSVTNYGPDTARFVEVADTLPENIEVKSISASKGSAFQSERLIIWAVGDIANGETDIITIIVKPLIAGRLVNKANVYARTVNPYWALGNIFTQEFTEVMDKAADLSISKEITTLTNKTIYVGDIIQYEIMVYNYGPMEATNAIVIDTLPKDVKFVSVLVSKGSASYSNGIISWQIGNMNSKEVVKTFINIIPMKKGTITNTATVSSDIEDTDLYDNTASVSTNILTKVADLSISKVSVKNPVYLEDLLSYQLTVTNLGPDTAVGTVVIDSLPQNVDFVSANVSKGSFSLSNGVITWEMDYITYKEIVTATINVQPHSIGEYANTVSVMAYTFDPNLINNTSTTTSTVITNLSTPPINLSSNANSLVILAQNTTNDTITVNITIMDLSPTAQQSTNINENIAPHSTKEFILDKPTPQFKVIFESVKYGIYFWVAARYETSDKPLDSSRFIADNTFCHARLINIS